MVAGVVIVKLQSLGGFPTSVSTRAAKAQEAMFVSRA
jgi:hypothetical protein